MCIYTLFYLCSVMAALKQATLPFGSQSLPLIKKKKLTLSFTSSVLTFFHLSLRNMSKPHIGTSLFIPTSFTFSCIILIVLSFLWILRKFLIFFLCITRLVSWRSNLFLLTRLRMLIYFCNFNFLQSFLTSIILSLPLSYCF